MTLNQMKYLVVLSKHNSFSRASEELNISQPALTIQIQKLEDELGFSLIDRNKKQIALTAEGEIIREKSIEILTMAENISEIALELENGINGSLNVGIIPTIAPYLTPLFLDNIIQAYPNLKLNIIELATEDIISELKLGDLDLGILATPIQSKSMKFMPLFYEKFYLFTSYKHELFSKESVKISEIETKDLWYLKEGNCFQNQVNSLCEISDNITVNQQLKYYSNSIESLRYIVEQRGGMTFIPELATLTIPPDQIDMVKEIDGVQPVREISIVTNKYPAKQKLIDVFKNVVLENIPKKMRTLGTGMILNTNI